MTGAQWWVVLAAAAVGAAAAISGSMWASRVQRRSAGRAEARRAIAMTKNKQVNDSAVDATPTARKIIEVNVAQIAAAKLQITLDRKFGRKTPEIIKQIAAAK